VTAADSDPELSSQDSSNPDGGKKEAEKKEASGVASPPNVAPDPMATFIESAKSAGLAPNIITLIVNTGVMQGVAGYVGGDARIHTTGTGNHSSAADQTESLEAWFAGGPDPRDAALMASIAFVPGA
jgi:hypothetical protein